MKKLSFADAVKSVFVNWNKFKGLATRREYWFFVLFTVLLGIVLSTVESIIWPTAISAPPTNNFDQSNLSISAFDSLLSSPLSTLTAALILIPQLSVMARRVRDAGFSGMWLLVLLLQIPVLAGAPEFLAYVNATPITDLEFPAGDFTLFAFTVFAALAGQVLVFVFTVLPSKSRDQGNKYAPEA
jgi:uncharacterized membrane protein YhaH (DUF805 family)